MSGAQAVALPAFDAPNIITKSAINTSATWIVGYPLSSTLDIIIYPPAQNRIAKTVN